MNIEEIIRIINERKQGVKKYSSKEINQKYEMNYDEYVLGCFLNHIPSENLYETYIYIINNKKTTAPILYSSSNDFNYIYNEFNRLKEIVAKNDLNSLID